MNAAQYIEFIERKAQQEVAHCCKYGHFDCSDRDGGRCSDEEYHLLSDKDREEVDNW
jgi:hypothetical protein